MVITQPIPQLSLSRQLTGIREEIDAAIKDIVDNTAFIGGKRVQQFEENFAAFCQSQDCIGVGNGTDALYNIFWALDLPPGSEVLVPAMSFIATLEPLSLLQLKPVLVDIDPKTYTLDHRYLSKAVTKATRAILPVHLYGQPAQMDDILAFAAQHGLVVIEDAAQAHGARFNGQRIGSFGKAAGFSFYPGKNLGAFGDGGAITTSDSEFADRIRRFSDHGRLSKYEHSFPGTNSRLDSLQAAILDIKLRHLDTWNDTRSQWASRYAEGLSNLADLTLPVTGENRTHVYHQYVIQTPQRDALSAFLGEQGIHTGLHYPIPLHLQPAYGNLGYKEGDFPMAERLGQQCLSLPMFAELTASEVDRVIQGIQTFFKGH